MSNGKIRYQVASIGPLLMVITIMGTPSLRKLSNAFVLNLAVSDLLFVIISCPTTLAQVAYESFATVGEIRVYRRADFQSGSRVLKKVF